MILIEKTETMGWDHVVRGMRNPMNSWDKSDSGVCKDRDGNVGCSKCAAYYNCDRPYDNSFQVGTDDYALMMKLAKAGPVHGKFRRMIVVYTDVTAPLYWWKEFDTYKVGTVANSCSTMHRIHTKEFTLNDFSHEHLMDGTEAALTAVISTLNMSREMFLETKNKVWWWQMIQLLPSSYNQKRTIMLNYEVLANIYQNRREHKLDEWREFCRLIERLPHSGIITGAGNMENEAQ
jgi:hypothetical protein